MCSCIFTLLMRLDGSFTVILFIMFCSFALFSFFSWRNNYFFSIFLCYLNLWFVTLTIVAGIWILSTGGQQLSHLLRWSTVSFLIFFLRSILLWAKNMSEKDFYLSLIIVKTKVLWSLQMSQVAFELLDCWSTDGSTSLIT